MWESEMFAEDQLILWDNQPDAQKTWQALQDYFTAKWLERRQFSQAMAKHSRFKDAALAAQELAAAEEEGEASAMMFALLQEQHKTQMDALATANQRAMKVMFEKMNAIIGTQGLLADKENNPPASNTPVNSNGGAKRAKKKCPNCGRLVFHKPTACLELETNAGKCWAGWKSCKDTTGSAT